MAGIRNSISLNDQMSPVLRNIVRSMNSTLKVMQNLDQQANKGTQSKAYQAAERDIRKADNALIKMQNDLDKCDAGAGRFARSVGSASNSTSRLNRLMSGLGNGGFNLINLSAALYLFEKIEKALGNIMAVSDTAQSLKYRMETYDTTKMPGTNTELNGDQLYQMAYQAATRSRSDLTSTGSLAARILVTGATGGNGYQSIKLAELLNKASFLGGSSGEESKRALLQLSQSLASGTLQGDELRAIREQAPGLTDMLSKGLTKLWNKPITTGQLKQLGADGKLTADTVIKAFNLMSDEINASFEKSPKLFDQAMTLIQNAVQYRFQALSNSINSVDGPLKSITDRMWQLADFLNSANGEDLFNAMASGVSVLSAILGDFFDLVVSIYQYLEDNSQLVSSAFISLGIIAAGSAAIALGSWMLVHWQFFVIFTVLMLIINALMSAGMTASQAGAMVAGVIAWIIALLWDIIVCIAGIIGYAIIIILDALIIIRNVFMTFGYGIKASFDTFMSGIIDTVLWGVQKILGALSVAATAIDAIFGTNFSTTVTGYINKVETFKTDMDKKFNPEDDYNAIKDLWSNSLLNPAKIVDGALGGLVVNPNDWYNKTYDKTQSTLQGLDGLNVKDYLSNMSDSAISDIAAAAENTAGNTAATANNTKNKTVDISDEDIQMLRDIAAHDFLVNLQSITPQAHITFGDVHETADVNKIMDVIDDMVAEQFATSLTTD